MLLSAVLLSSSAETATALNLEPVITILSSAGGGVVLLTALLLTRRLVTIGEYSEMKADRDLTRQALELERDRNDRLENVLKSSVQQGETVLHLVQSIAQGPPRDHK